MDDATTPDAVSFTVALADDPLGPSNRVVVFDWFAHPSVPGALTPEATPPSPEAIAPYSPPRGGNRVEVLVDGEAAWAAVADALEHATQEIQIATWMCRPDSELRRPLADALTEPDARAEQTMGAILERRAHAGARVRLLIWGMVYTPILDRWMRRWFWRGHDNIDVLEQDHPGITGSYHQKTLTVDGRIGFCGGMNIKENDWDTTAHDPWDPRRFPHRSDAWTREAAVRRQSLPPFLPRHDLMVRLEGPAVGDLVLNFAQRWQQSLAARRKSPTARLVDAIRTRLGSDPNVELDAAAPTHAVAGDTWVQIVRTTPGGEDGILAAYERAIRNARRYIYIENQYFRSPAIGEAIARAIVRNPRLHVVVVAWPIKDGEVSFLDPSGYYTAATATAIRTARPDFQLTRLLVAADPAAGGRTWVPIDVHAKVMIIDDEWFTVGSANVNDRGFRTEAEINAVVVDAALATDLRRRLMAEHLLLAADDPRLDDPDAVFALWHAHALANVEARSHEGEPVSRVHYFEQQAPPWPPFRIGPGVF